MSLTFSVRINWPVLQILNTINQSQTLFNFEFDSKIASFVIESSVHLCRSERKRLQTLWEPNFIPLTINLAECWNFQRMHAVIEDGSL